jgi:hypothetical protein
MYELRALNWHSGIRYMDAQPQQLSSRGGANAFRYAA